MSNDIELTVDMDPEETVKLDPEETVDLDHAGTVDLDHDQTADLDQERTGRQGVSAAQTAETRTVSADVKWKRIALILIALVGVALIAGIVCVRSIKTARYNEQIEIADKALVEGDYEQAETGYLAAIAIDPKKTRAREGVAYVALVTGRKEEAWSEYKDLYDDTGDIKYNEAADEVQRGRMPSDPSLIPAPGIWRELPDGSLPDPDGLAELIEAAAAMGIGPDPEFRSEDPASCNWMVSILWSEWKLRDLITEDLGTGGKYYDIPDPNGIAEYKDSGYFYCVMNYEVLQKMAEQRFNISKEDFDAMLEAEGSALYKAGDKIYYTDIYPTDFGVKTSNILKVSTNGEHYLVEYEEGFPDYDSWDSSTMIRDPADGYMKGYALVTVRKEDGRSFWSMLYNGTEPPEEYKKAMEEQTSDREDPQNSGDGDKTADGEKTANGVFAQLNGLTFNFSSGAGGWSTEMTIAADGSFTGRFHDSDMGVTGPGYPGGTVTYCDFSGKFADPVKIDDYTYEFTVGDIKYEGETGDSHIENDVKFEVYNDAYGLSGTDKVRLYLPGRSTDDFSDNCKMWLYGSAMEEDYIPVLKIYVLHNLKGDMAFSGYPE